MSHFWFKLRSYKRAFLGRCPYCNSVDLAVEKCPICANDRTYPQTDARMAYRLWIHFCELEEQENKK